MPVPAAVPDAAEPTAAGRPSAPALLLRSGIGVYVALPTAAPLAKGG